MVRIKLGQKQYFQELKEKREMELQKIPSLTKENIDCIREAHDNVLGISNQLVNLNEDMGKECNKIEENLPKRMIAVGWIGDITPRFITQKIIGTNMKLARLIFEDKIPREVAIQQLSHNCVFLSIKIYNEAFWFVSNASLYLQMSHNHVLNTQTHRIKEDQQIEIVKQTQRQQKRRKSKRMKETEEFIVRQRQRQQQQQT